MEAKHALPKALLCWSSGPCGERGEFHTFAYAGPMFREPVTIRSDEIVSRDGFVFADLY
jgi:diphthamide synthase (EF-2-diphthine--ammonia ligase)